MRITELIVPKLRPGVHMDDRTPDFGIRIGKKRRTWIAIVGRGRVKTTLGHFPQLSLTDARSAAKQLLAGENEPRNLSVSFIEARTAFLDRYANPRTRYQVSRALERHLKPLDSMQLTDITHEHIARCLATLADRPSEQLHTFRYARALFNWSAKAPRKWVKVSPMYGYDPPSTDKKGSRTLTDAELAAIWYASPPIFRLMILWGTRNTETCVLEREWETGEVLTIPGKHTKNGRDHAIPILPLARHVLSSNSPNSAHENNGAIKGHNSIAYFFPGRWGGHLTHSALPKLKAEVMEKSGTKDWQIRDIRRTFRSNMARLGVSRDVAEVLINHAPPTLDDIYDRYDKIAEKREALAKYEHALIWLLALA